MDLPWGDERSVKFITNVGLITSDGPNGPNVMAAEWTHHVSYSPGLIVICLGFTKATVDNIRETKEFGVNIASTKQSVMSSVTGGYTGKEFDKVAALKELGFRFYPGKSINVIMVSGAAMNAECKLVEEKTFGDHIMFIGEVVESSAGSDEPVAYHQGKYWKMDTNVPKPSDEERAKIKEVVEKYKK